MQQSHWLLVEWTRAMLTSWLAYKKTSSLQLPIEIWSLKKVKLFPNCQTFLRFRLWTWEQVSLLHILDKTGMFDRRASPVFLLLPVRKRQSCTSRIILLSHEPWIFTASQSSLSIWFQINQIHSTSPIRRANVRHNEVPFSSTPATAALPQYAPIFVHVSKNRSCLCVHIHQLKSNCSSGSTGLESVRCARVKEVI